MEFQTNGVSKLKLSIFKAMKLLKQKFFHLNLTLVSWTTRGDRYYQDCLPVFMK